MTTKFLPLAFMLAAVKQRILVNGHELPPASWGRTVIPIPPGQHHLHVHTQYFFPPKMGPADLMVPLQPGQIVELEYRAPVWTFSKGSLGPPPQNYNGMVPMIAVMGFVFLVIILSTLVNLAS